MMRASVKCRASASASSRANQIIDAIKSAHTRKSAIDKEMWSVIDLKHRAMHDEFLEKTLKITKPVEIIVVTDKP
jgi:hypothetical protein